jgi:hypothetical protein
MEIIPREKTYRLLGCRLVTDFEFDLDLSSTPQGTVADETEVPVHFTCREQPPPFANASPGRMVFSSLEQSRTGNFTLHLFRHASYDLLRIEGLADYYLGVDYIYCHINASTQRNFVQEMLFGTVMACWLERQGIPVMHAAAIATRSGVVAFPSFSGDGKTTLATAFLQAGIDLLSDDTLPLQEKDGQFWAQPGVPQLNLWPSQRKFFLQDGVRHENSGQAARKRRIPVSDAGFGAFCDQARPLARFYLLNRSDRGQGEAEIKILPVSPAEAVMQLSRFSLTPNIVESLGLQPERMRFLARLVHIVPVRRLVYPNGFEYLPNIVEAVLADLKE